METDRVIRGEECRIGNQLSHLSQGPPWCYPLNSRSGIHLFLFSRVCSKTVMSWDNVFWVFFCCFFFLKDSKREVVLGQSIVFTRQSPKLHSGTFLPVTSTVHLLKMSDVSSPDNLTEIYPHCNHVLPLVSRWENGKLAGFLSSSLNVCSSVGLLLYLDFQDGELQDPKSRKAFSPIIFFQCKDWWRLLFGRGHSKLIQRFSP